MFFYVNPIHPLVFEGIPPFNLTPPLLEGSPPSPSPMVEGNPPYYVRVYLNSHLLPVPSERMGQPPPLCLTPYPLRLWWRGTPS